MNHSSMQGASARRGFICGLVLCATAASAQSDLDAATPASGAARLAPVTVSGNRETAYQAPATGIATKSEVPLLESPLSVQVVPRQVLDDQRVSSLKEAVKNVSGVTQPGYDFYDFLQIRGFDNGYAANYRNGLQLQAITNLDMALVERIEVVKGPASMLYGRIEPGGLVNQVMKRPQPRFAAQGDVEAGSYGWRRTTLDVTGPLGDDPTLSYRVTGAYTDSDSFMDYVHRRNATALASIAWQPSTRFELNASLELQQLRFADTEDIGIPAIGDRMAPVPRHRYYGDPVNWEVPNQQHRALVALDWTYAFDEHWKLTQRLHWDQRHEQQLTFWSNGFDAATGEISRGIWYVHPERSTFATNLDLQGDVEAAGLRHRVLVGADLFRFRSRWHGVSSAHDDVVPPINLVDPQYGVSAEALRALPEDFYYVDRDEWAGLYAQDQLTLNERWQLLFGGRYDVARTGSGSSGTSVADARSALSLSTDHAFSPRVGVLYQLASTTSLYLSYAKSFGTNNGRSATGAGFEPQQARQVELGAKFQSPDGRLTATAAVYRLTKTNILTADVSTPAPDDQVAIGAVRHQGLELDLLGRVLPQLDLIASYSTIDSEITVDHAGNQGHRMPNVPRHSGSLWAKFESAPGAPQGWQAGLGVYARSQREADRGNTWQLPGYARVDAMLGYRLPVAGSRVTAQLNVENLFDRTYVDRAGSGGSGGKYGKPRALTATVGVAF